MDGDAVWAASGAHVIKYLRGKEVRILRYSTYFFVDSVTGFPLVESAPDPLGILHYIWLSVACIDGRWRADANMGGIDQWCAFCLITASVCFMIISERALSATIQFDIGFTATSILHPATYLNKVLVASNEGDMQLWNIRTQ
jgi:U3 small nucleolar RNA-associated protein 21